MTLRKAILSTTTYHALYVPLLMASIKRAKTLSKGGSTPSQGYPFVTTYRVSYAPLLLAYIKRASKFEHDKKHPSRLT